MTNLEAISIKLKEEKDKELESILKISGSAANVKNEYGVTIVDDTNAASSLVFKNLSKPKYDDVELIKAIDVDIKELKPNIPTPNLDLVPRPLYTEQVDLVADLRKQVERLTITITDLNSQITTLQAQVQTEINNRLSVEQTNDVLANQIDTLTNTINDFTGQISTSLQKSVDESILRASLQSQNAGFKAQIEALIQQINSLNSIIEGLQAQLGAVRQQKEIEQETKGQGGENINKVVSANFDKKGVPSDPVMSYKQKNARDKAREWIFGENLTLINNDLEPVQVSIVAIWDQDQKWFSIPKANFQISPGATERIKFIDTPNNIKFGRRDNTVFYEGSLNITIKRKDGKDVVFCDYFGNTIYRPPPENAMTPEVDVIDCGIALPEIIGNHWALRVNKLMEMPEYLALVIRLAEHYSKKNHKVLVLQDRVEFAQLGTENRPKAVAITGKLKEGREEEMARIFTDMDEIWGITSIFKEGISLDILSCLILAGPVNNEPMLEQLVGRIQRPMPNKQQPKLVDIKLSGWTGSKQFQARLGFYMRMGYKINYI